MKKSILLSIIFAFVLITTPAFALLNSTDDHSVNANAQQGQQQTGINIQEQGIDSNIDSRNTNTNLLGNDQEQKQGIFDSGNSDNENRNTNTNLLGNDQDQSQGQDQSQVGINKNYNQDFNANKNAAIQGQSNDINIEGDDVEGSYAFAPPAIHAQKGTSTANMYSIFGGVGLSQTEEYTIAIEKIAVIERLEALGYISKEEAISEARAAFADLDSASQPKRVFGVLGKTRGRHLLNGLGLFSFDSFWAEGQEPFHGKKNQ